MTLFSCLYLFLVLGWHHGAILYAFGRALDALATACLQRQHSLPSFLELVPLCLPYHHLKRLDIQLKLLCLSTIRLGTVPRFLPWFWDVLLLL